jgi:hypothetical protein
MAVPLSRRTAGRGIDSRGSFCPELLGRPAPTITTAAELPREGELIESATEEL